MCRFTLRNGAGHFATAKAGVGDFVPARVRRAADAIIRSGISA